MVQPKKSKSTRGSNVPSGLTSALLLKQKLLAQQKGGPKNRVTKSNAREISEKRLRTAKALDLKSKRPKDQDSDEEDNEADSKVEDEESEEDEEDHGSVTDLMRIQFEKQFGKVKGIGKPVTKSVQPEVSKPGKSKTSKASSKTEKQIPIKKAEKNKKSIKSFLNGFEKGLSDSESEEYSDFEVEDYDDMDNEEEQEEDEGPVVVKFDDSNKSYSGATSQTESTSRREKRLFMSSKAPAAIEARETSQVKSTGDDDEDEEDKILTQEDMKNDLELQRLLRESHLLSEARELGHLSGYDVANAYVSDTKIGLSGFSEETHNSKGKGALFGDVRLKTMEMRMDLIGMKRKQAKPLNMKVLQQQAKERKLDRRRQIDEARESGVVLATSILRKQEKGKKRDRNTGLKFEQMGKQTKHGILLSKRDIAKISEGKE